MLFFRTMTDDTGASGAGETIIEFDTSIDTATKCDGVLGDVWFVKGSNLRQSLTAFSWAVSWAVFDDPLCDTINNCSCAILRLLILDSHFCCVISLNNLYYFFVQQFIQ